ncbi:hypothetical protein [Paenarthrobacter histidinolovorans]|uniref:Uncharacterized protein n=1 Tax=Paenarthrobacter histidinolovorans TaxID=43664 RepID=A0ABW8N6P4_9MICC|nr:hypothetical protein [Paenarthrobacter histidinolovorans]GGJ24051.1 hypothetical protein GCM10010052_21460 [Paenarthrobacter histidinolovorans]
MMLNETIAHLRAAHLMVRDAEEWDALSAALTDAYGANDEDLIEQLQPPFLQSWRTVTRYVLRDTFDNAGISVADPNDPWGIAILTSHGVAAEPVLCTNVPAGLLSASTTMDSPIGGTLAGRRLMTFPETMDHYAESLRPLFSELDARQVG